MATRAPLVLVVEDRASIRQLLDIALTEEGFRVVGAATAEEGLAAAKAEPPDVVLLDLLLPGPGGEALAFALRRLPGLHRVPIVVLSGLDGGLEAARAVGAQDFVAKPFDLRDLVARIRRQLASAPA
jgi:DNA-binding response OmpR family regulator